MITVEIDDRKVLDALAKLARRGTDMTPVMQDIGEYLVESTKRRFVTSRAPDGSRWAENSDTTLLNYLGAFKGSFRKDGGLTQKGAKRLGAKKPLVGETGRLSSEIHHRASRTAVEVGSSLVYSGTQQFGARHGQYGNGIPWGDIPPRPFLGLSSEDERHVLDIIGGWLVD